MSFQLTEPTLVIGIGGVGAKLAIEAKEALNADCLLISNDNTDFDSKCSTIKIDTKSIVNPSIQLLRGATFSKDGEIRAKISAYSTVILVANLAGKSGAGVGPVISRVCKEENQNLISFAIMPFEYQKERIFSAGVSLKRLRNDSQCTIVLDNNAIIESNPDLSPAKCHQISNEAIMHVISSLKTSNISEDTNIISTSKTSGNVETSLKDSIRMLYEDAPPTSVRRTVLHVLGGNNVPVGMLNSITSIASSIFNNESTSVSTSVSESNQSKVVMVTSVQGETLFDKYDPLGIISSENTIDWEEPECSINCELKLPQLE